MMGTLSIKVVINQNWLKRKRKLLKRHWVSPRNAQKTGEVSLGNCQEQAEAGIQNQSLKHAT